MILLSFITSVLMRKTEKNIAPDVENHTFQARVAANAYAKEAIRDLNIYCNDKFQTVFNEVKAGNTSPILEDQASDLGKVRRLKTRYSIRPIATYRDTVKVDIEGLEYIDKILFQATSTANLVGEDGRDYEAETKVEYEYGVKTIFYYTEKPLTWREVTAFMMELKNDEIELKQRNDQNWAGDAYTNDKVAPKIGHYNEESTEIKDNDGTLFIKGDTRIRGTYGNKLTIIVKGNIYIDHDINYTRASFPHRGILLSNNNAARINGPYQAINYLFDGTSSTSPYYLPTGAPASWAGLYRYWAAGTTTNSGTVTTLKPIRATTSSANTATFTFYSDQTLRGYDYVTNTFGDPTQTITANNGSNAVKPPRSNLVLYAIADENGHGGNILISCNICDSTFDVWDVYLNATMYAQGEIRHERMGTIPANYVTRDGANSGALYSTLQAVQGNPRECINNGGYASTYWPKGIINVRGSSEPYDAGLHQNVPFEDMRILDNRVIQGTPDANYNKMKNWTEVK
jgi:hypothetical protein